MYKKMYTNTTENTNGINLDLVSRNITTVAKLLKVSPGYVTSIAKDRVLLSQRDNSTVRVIILALNKVEDCFSEIEELGKLRNNKRRKPTAE